MAAEAAQSVRWIASDASFKRAWLTERVMTVLERRSKTVRGKSAVRLTKNALLTLAKGRADGAPLISQNLFLRFLSRPEFAPPSVLVVAQPHQDESPERPRTLRPRLAAMVAAVESLDAREPPKTKGPEAPAPEPAPAAFPKERTPASPTGAASASRASPTAAVLKAFTKELLNAKLVFPDMQVFCALDLFSGTESLRKALEKICRRHGLTLEYTSFDILEKFNPTFQADIKDWEKVLGAKFKVGHFHFIWASPDCRYLSYANTQATPAQIRKAARNVRHALACITHFDPPSWCVENPVGRLKTHAVMKNMQREMCTVSYCVYGAPYCKPTNFWANFGWLCTLQKCSVETPCNWKGQGHERHLCVAQSGETNGVKNGVARETAYVVPEELVNILATAAAANASREGEIERGSGVAREEGRNKHDALKRGCEEMKREEERARTGGARKRKR